MEPPLCIIKQLYLFILFCSVKQSSRNTTTETTQNTLVTDKDRLELESL